MIPDTQRTGAVLAALSEQALGADAPETRALAWLTEQSEAGTLRQGVVDLGLTVEEGSGFGYRLYEAVVAHFKEAAA